MSSQKVRIKSFTKKKPVESVAIPFSTFTLSLEKKRVFLNNSFGVQLLNDVAGDAKFRTQGASIIFQESLNLTN